MFRWRRSGLPSLVRLEQLDRVARRVLEQNLSASVAVHDLVAEPRSLALQPFNGVGQVGNLELDSVPAARTGRLPIRHGLAGAATATRSIQQQTKIAARHSCEARCWMHVELEAQQLRVEGN